MRRGSIPTWEPLARRHSSSMAQFSNSRSEFMTSDIGLNDIEYERKGGFFMTHKKTALTVSVVVVIIIAAGFVGAYIGSVPKEKTYDTLALIDGDIGCEDVGTSKFSLSDAIHPSRYRIELSPIIENDRMTRLRGHVTIEFRYNGSASLSELVFNAKGITFVKIKLMTGITLDAHGTRRKRNTMELSKDGQGNPTLLVDGSSYITPGESLENDNTRFTDANSDLDTAADSVLITKLDSENYTNYDENGVNGLVANSTNVNLSNNSMVTEKYSMDDVELHDSHGVQNSGTKTNEDISDTSASEDSGTSEDVKKNESSEVVINSHELDDEYGFIALYLATPIEAGEYFLEITYEVRSFGASYNGSNDEKMLAKRPRVTKVRNFFPVFDDVRMKARFSLTVPRAEGTNILSNMPILSTNTSVDKWVQVTFQETPPIAPQNLVIIESHQESSDEFKITDPPIDVFFWSEPSRYSQTKYFMGIFEPVIRHLTDFFNGDYGIRKLDAIGLPYADYSSGYPGLITIQDSLYYIKDDSSVVTTERASMNLIKLIGQQWLGGLVNTQNSSDVWILESSLLYLQHQLLSKINPGFNHSTFIMDVQPDALEASGYSVSRSLQSELNPSHSHSVLEAYAMGACLISMLHGVLNQTKFRDGYRSFVSRWTGRNADEESFWEAMTSEYTEEHKESEINLAEIMHFWTTASGYPVVTVTRKDETGSVAVHQARFSFDKTSVPSEQLWHIPLTWITAENRNISFKWLEPEVETTLELIDQTDNNSWIVFNPTKSGYFRVNYDAENWKLLAEALRQNHKMFSSETRACLVDDVFSLAFVGLVPYSTVFDLIDYLPGKEREPEPWTYLKHHALKLNLALYDSPVYISYQEFMVKFLADLYGQIESELNQGTRMTLILHELACTFDYPDYLAWAKKNYFGFEVTTGLPIQNNVPSYLYKNLLCAFAKLEHELSWQWWQQKFTNVTNREERNSLLSSLACFQKSWMLQAVLNEIVFSTNFEEEDTLVILENFSTYPAASQAALKFVQSHWKNITRRYPKSCEIVSAFLDASSTGFTSEKDVEDFQGFRDKNFESLKKVGYITALLEAKANATVSFLKISLPNLQLSLDNRTDSENTFIQID